MHSYIQTFKNGFKFSGRASRTEFWVFFVVNCLLSAAIVFAGVFGLVGWSSMMKGGAGLATVVIGVILTAGIVAIFSLVTLIPTLAVAARRLHDSGRSGKWLMLYLPVIAIAAFGAVVHSEPLQHLASCCEIVVHIVMVVFMLLPSSTDENQYGPKVASN